jgi:hypothetical protein
MDKRARSRAGRKGAYASAKRRPLNMRLRAHLGGIARMAKLTPEERSALGKKAARASAEARQRKKGIVAPAAESIDDDIVV